jgi:predicted small metal-binding protein
MAKMLSCREAGMDCDFVARGETDDEVMRNGFEHGKRDHGMTDDMLMDQDLQQRMRSMIRDESSAAPVVEARTTPEPPSEPPRKPWWKRLLGG